MSSTQRAAKPDTTRVDDELLTMQEVADVVRVPVATCAIGATSAPGRAASASAAASATGAGRYSPGSTTRPMVIPRASSDIMPIAEVAQYLTVSTGARTSSASRLVLRLLS